MSSSILEHLDLIDAVCDLDIGVCENSLSNFNMRVDFPGDARRKESACQCRRHKRHGFNLWVRKIPWNKKCQKKKRNVNPLQYSCLENPMDRGDWQATIHGVAEVGHD